MNNIVQIPEKVGGVDVTFMDSKQVRVEVSKKRKQLALAIAQFNDDIKELEIHSAQKSVEEAKAKDPNYIHHRLYENEIVWLSVLVMVKRLTPANALLKASKEHDHSAQWLTAIKKRNIRKSVIHDCLNINQSTHSITNSRLNPAIKLLMKHDCYDYQDLYRSSTVNSLLNKLHKALLIAETAESQLIKQQNELNQLKQTSAALIKQNKSLDKQLLNVINAANDLKSSQQQLVHQIATLVTASPRLNTLEKVQMLISLGLTQKVAAQYLDVQTRTVTRHVKTLKTSRLLS